MGLKSMINNYKKPTPVKWRKIGDYILVVQVFITGSLPTWPLPENQKVIIGSIVNFIGVSLKFWTNTKKHPEDPAENTDASKPEGNI